MADEPATYLIAKLPDPSSLPEYGLAWWNMDFVKVNDKPTPFKTREDAQGYIDVWSLAERGFAVYSLSKL